MAEPSEEELEDLGKRIEEAKRDAEEDGLLPEEEPDEPTYADPNPEGRQVHEELIDETIVPPG